MVSMEVPKPPQGFFERFRDSIKLATAYVKGDKTTIASITSDTQFSPLQPLQPPRPFMPARAWDFSPGINVQMVPRGYSDNRIPFVRLESASYSELIRLVIETVKDQVCAFNWSFVPKDDSDVEPDDPRCKELTDFFKFPDKRLTWEQWLRMILEELLVTDAISIYRPKDMLGRPYAFEVLSGSTIKVLVDEDGRRPETPDPAYQQYLKGMVRSDFTTDELLYMPRNLLPRDPRYGYSPTEQVLITADTALRRARFQNAYFSEGSLPDAYAEMPEGMTPDKIEEFERRFNDILSGNLIERRKVPFLPSGTKIATLKPDALKDEFDEWLARIACFAYGIPPTAFIRQMNRGTAQNDQERAQEEGQAPKMRFIKLIMDILKDDFGPEYADFEFSWGSAQNIDPKEQADVETEYVKAGIKTINEARDAIGLDPDPASEANQLMVITATGPVPLDQFEQNQDMQQKNMDAQAKAKAAAPQNQANQSGASKSAYKRRGRQVRHKPIPFDRPHVRAAEAALAHKITAILRDTGKHVADQARKIFEKLNKDDGDQSDFAQNADLSGLNMLINATPAEIAAIMANTGQLTLLQLGIEDETGLTGQINADSLDYAMNRAAEMVGRKWMNGELVDNPNADWVITDSTRDMLNEFVVSVLDGSLPASQLPQAILDSTAFSPARAQMIARTELMAASGQGSLAGYRTARANGVKVRKSWEADPQACDECQANAEEGDIDIDDDFQSGDDAPPAHPNCECVLVPVTEEEDD